MASLNFNKYQSIFEFNMPSTRQGVIAKNMDSAMDKRVEIQAKKQIAAVTKILKGRNAILYFRVKKDVTLINSSQIDNPLWQTSLDAINFFHEMNRKKVWWTKNRENGDAQFNALTLQLKAIIDTNNWGHTANWNKDRNFVKLKQQWFQMLARLVRVEYERNRKLEKQYLVTINDDFTYGTGEIWVNKPTREKIRANLKSRVR